MIAKPYHDWKTTSWLQDRITIVRPYHDADTIDKIVSHSPSSISASLLSPIIVRVIDSLSLFCPYIASLHHSLPLSMLHIYCPNCISQSACVGMHGLLQRSTPCLMHCDIYTCISAPAWRVHHFHWGCISCVWMASLLRAFSFNSRSTQCPKDVLFTCTNAHEEFISSSGTAFLLSQLHLFRVCSLWNPYPHGMDYFSDLYYAMSGLQRILFFTCTNAPEEIISCTGAASLLSQLHISSACVLF